MTDQDRIKELETEVKRLQNPWRNKDLSKLVHDLNSCNGLIRHHLWWIDKHPEETVNSLQEIKEQTQRLEKVVDNFYSSVKNNIANET